MDGLARIARAARTTVLISGELGVGKRALARAVHERSARGRGPWREVMAAESDRPDFLEATLGEGGAAARAQGGTLLVHEIALLQPPAQERLLTELREGRFDTRFVVTTSRDLEHEVESGRFCEDLLYRLNVLTLAPAPLRERTDDLPAIASHLVAALAADLGRAAPSIGEDALERLAEQAWPGNLRELRAVLETALLRADEGEELAPTHLGGASGAPGDALPLGDRRLRAVEEALIRRVLAEVDGNRSHAARVLGINRQTLYNKLRAFGPDRERASA